MRRLVSLMVSFCIIVSLCGTAFASESDQCLLNVQEGRLINLPNVQSLIDEYFMLREQAFSDEKEHSKYVAKIADISSNNTLLLTKEEQRLSARTNLAVNHGVYVISANNSAFIVSATLLDKKGSEILLNVYEWTWLQYNNGKGGPIDELGYATEHQIMVEEKIDGNYTIAYDIYDEDEILGNTLSSNDLSISYDIPIPMDSSSTAGVNSNVSYKVNTVIDYADSWVIHEYASSMQNSTYYNLTTYGYYSADCANFVSQCMRAGGMQWDYGSGKDNGNWDGTQWWFDINPNPNYENYNVSPPSWRYVPKFIEYWNNQGYASVTATTSSVYPGNPVYVSGHVGICVGYNSSGTPIINAHNRDVYHVPYTMIGSSTKNTIQITTSNMMLHTPSGATTLTLTTTNQTTPLKYIAAGSNHYYVLSVNTPGYYTFESSYYSNTSFDSKAYLYKESQTSNGQTLYMYEVAQDDDSGTGLNFKIRTYLSAGTYYLRVRGYSQTTTGYYYLNYKQG